MELALKLLFAAIFVVMAWINVKAALAMNNMASLPLYSANQWVVATLYDAYCGFLTLLGVGGLQGMGGLGQRAVVPAGDGVGQPGYVCLCTEGTIQTQA